MKLIAAHIENFGTLHGQDFSFTEGANVILRDNGWGKSTFAAFLRAMFYGLAGDKKRNVEENERARYMPWQGGSFGGSLTFETNGEQYLVTRFFGKKASEDTFELRNVRTNGLSSDLSEKLGEELFRIDRESFLRTVFLGQNDCETGATDDIHGRIGRIIESTNDINNYDTAVARLNGALNSLTPNRATGSTAKRKTEMAKLSVEIGSFAGLEEEIGRETAVRKAAQQAAAEEEALQRSLESQRQKRSELQQILAGAEERARLQERIRRREEEVLRTRAVFPGRIPIREEIAEMQALCEPLAAARQTGKDHMLTAGEERQRQELDRRFRTGVPEEEQLDRMLTKANRLEQLRGSSGELSTYEEQRLEELEKVFGRDNLAVSEYIRLWNVRNLRLSTIEGRKAERRRNRREMPAAAASYFLPLGALLLILGVIFAVWVSVIPGILLLILGAAAVIFGVLQRRNSGGPDPAEDDLEEQLLRENIILREQEERIRQYLKEHGIAFEPETAERELYLLQEQEAEYRTLAGKKRRALDQGRERESEQLREELRLFLEQWNDAAESGESILDVLYRMKSDAAVYRELSRKQTAAAGAEEKSVRLEQQIRGFFAELQIPCETSFREGLQRLLDDLDDYTDAVRELAEERRTLTQVEEGLDPKLLAETERLAAALPEPDTLKKEQKESELRLQAARERILRSERVLEELKDSLEEREDRQEELRRLQEKQAEELARFRYLSKAKEALEKARDAMTARYADPLLAAFGEYYRAVTGRSAEAFRLDANTEITLEKNGIQRERQTLSAGYRDLIGICLRIAMVDAMYTEERPMLVMDDPFVNLDDDNLQGAMRLLGQVSEKYQVIYFTCSSARVTESPEQAGTGIEM